tara:strand:- start:15 stop:527 length:513 start_codon:yes stop_codon:yes gene_type:complete
MNKNELKKHYRSLGNTFDDELFCGQIQRNRLESQEINPTPVYSPFQAAEEAKKVLQFAELERKVKYLERKYHELSSLIDCHTAVKYRGFLVDPKISTIVSITKELFTKTVISVDVEQDPDEDDSDFVIFNVSCKGDLNEILEKEIEWNRRVQEAESGHSGQLRLNVCPVE